MLLAVLLVPDLRLDTRMAVSTDSYSMCSWIAALGRLFLLLACCLFGIGRLLFDGCTPISPADFVVFVASNLCWFCLCCYM